MNIFKNGDAKNFNVKLFTLSNMFPAFVNKTIKFMAPDLTNQYLDIVS